MVICYLSPTAINWRIFLLWNTRGGETSLLGTYSLAPTLTSILLHISTEYYQYVLCIPSEYLSIDMIMMAVKS
jgi:hypothetical protein